MPTYDVNDASEALDAHVRAFFAGHSITRQQWPLGPVEQRIPGFFVYSAGPGPRFPGWSYLTSGCWKATAQHQHGLEFVLSTNTADPRHVELLTMLAYYHAGPESQRLDLGHTVPIGQPWMPGSLCEFQLIALPYAYGPDLELCTWPTGHTRILATQPITKPEHTLKTTQGLEALEQRLEATEADFANPHRPSVA
jgi:hypothetical protein